MKIGVCIEVAETPDNMGMFGVVFIESGKLLSRWDTLEKAREIGESWARELEGEPKPWGCKWNDWDIETRKKYARKGL
jgi:hypothetical protein